MQRIITLDIIKTIAIFVVIIAHLLFLYEDEITIMRTFNTIISCIGVPLFMCTSGALILKKKLNNWENIKNFYTHNLLSIVLTGELWIIIYYIINTNSFSIKELVFNIIFIYKPEIHLWYIRMICMYYIAMPFISYLHKKETLTIAVISIIFCITFLYNGYLIYEGEIFPTTPGLSYTCYLLYLLGGYYISSRKTRSINIYIIIATLTISIMLLFYTHNKNHYMVWYDNPFILIISLSLFELIYRKTENFKITPQSKHIINIISDISSMSFGIYLSHMIFIIIARHYFTHLNNDIDIIIYLIALIILLLSILLIKITKKINSKLAYIIFRY